MFSAFLPFFKRAHAASSEPTSMTVDQLRESVSQVMQSLAANSWAAQGLKAEMLSDTSNWTERGAHGDHPAKYETFAARITRIGAPSPTTDEFMLMTPAESIAPSTNSFAAFAARVPDSVQHALSEMYAEKPTVFPTEPTSTGPASPPVEPPQTRIPSNWDIPPLR